jgi:outer membrane immunogenic protein
MRKLTVAVLGVLVSACLTQTGHAQEKRKRASGGSQATTTNTNWNGLQTGANGGNSSLAQNFAEPGAFLCPTYSYYAYYAPACVETDFRFSGRPSSLTLGGFTGYRIQIGNMVIGVEGDLAWKKATTSLVQPGITALDVKETFTGSMTQGWDGSLRGRVGALLTPSLLLYATAGLAFGDVSGTFSYDAKYGSGCSAASVTGAKTWDDIRLGYTVGGGLETDVGLGLKARLEYRYTDFGRISKDVPLTSTGCEYYSCGTNAHIDMNAAFHTVRLGLGVDL